MPTDPSDSPALRASDADRDRVVDLLRAAVTDGRLDPAEFDERLGAALAARTINALIPLTADLVAAPGRSGAFGPIPAGTSVTLAEPAVERLTIKEKHGTVRREGRWTLPHHLRVRTRWSSVTLDLTRAVRSGPELIIELNVRGGGVDLVLAPGMVVDANGLAVRFAELAIDHDLDADADTDVGAAVDAQGSTPETLHIRLVGRIKHGRVATIRRRQAARG